MFVFQFQFLIKFDDDEKISRVGENNNNIISLSNSSDNRITLDEGPTYNVVSLSNSNGNDVTVWDTENQVTLDNLNGDTVFVFGGEVYPS